MDNKTIWATTVLAAVMGLVGALVGAFLGASAALEAADRQATSQREDRLVAERTEMNLQVLDASSELWWAWGMYKAVYPEGLPEKDYWTTYVMPRSNELQKSVTRFEQAAARTRAYGSTSATEATDALARCSQDLLSATEGPNSSRLPPSEDQWSKSATCFNDATSALEEVIQSETLPGGTAEARSADAAGEDCGFFWCPFG